MRDLESGSLSSLSLLTETWRSTRTEIWLAAKEAEKNKEEDRNTLSNKFMCMHICQHTNKQKEERLISYTQNLEDLGNFLARLLYVIPLFFSDFPLSSSAFSFFFPLCLWLSLSPSFLSLSSNKNIQFTTMPDVNSYMCSENSQLSCSILLWLSILI